MHFSIVLPASHLELDRIHIFCPRHSFLLWRTSGSHLCGLLWYSCRISPPQKWRGRHIYLHWRFLQMCTELSGLELGARMKWISKPKKKKSYLDDLWPMISLVVGWNVNLTFTWAEAVFPVFAVVSCGGTPWKIVCTAHGGTGGIGFALKSKGKVAHGTLRIPIESLHN